MPYRKFVQNIKGKKKYCLENKRTGKVTCYGSDKKRVKGARIREFFTHKKK